MEEPKLTVDKEFYIRVLEEDKFSEAKKLKENSKEFLEKTDRFNTVLGSFMTMIEAKTKLIEDEKLRAIGFRNQVEGEKDGRKRKQSEMELLIEEKRNELERYTKQLESIQRMEHEQKLLMEKLSNNEV